MTTSPVSITSPSNNSFTNTNLPQLRHFELEGGAEQYVWGIVYSPQIQRQVQPRKLIPPPPYSPIPHSKQPNPLQKKQQHEDDHDNICNFYTQNNPQNPPNHTENNAKEQNNS